MIGEVMLFLTISTSAPTQAPPRFGADKIKHFFASAFVQSVAFSAARAAGVDRSSAHVAAGVSTMAIGVWKEYHDRRLGKPFSKADLAWDAAGALAAAAILNGTR